MAGESNAGRVRYHEGGRNLGGPDRRMGTLGWQETVFIFVLALLMFGPKKLPELGKTLAKALGEFRRASSELKDTWQREMSAIERETQSIKDEANKLTSLTEVTDPSTYNYDSSYDYGAYNYPDSYDSTGSTSATQAEDEHLAQTHPAGATETTDATTPATAETPLKAVTPEGVVAVDEHPAASAESAGSTPNR